MIMINILVPPGEKLMRPPVVMLRPSLYHEIVGAGRPSAAHRSSARPPVLMVRFSGCVVKLGATEILHLLTLMSDVL